MTTIISTRSPYIDGKYVVGEGISLPVTNPATEEMFTEVETTSVEQVETAVLAARRAFDIGDWAWADKRDRVRLVLRMLDYFEEHRDELGRTIQQEAGATTRMLGSAQLDHAIAQMRQTVDLYLSLPDQEYSPRPLDVAVAANSVGLSVMTYEPVGVVSCISAYNCPFWINAWKAIPALLTGNTVVLRPSPLTPLSALVFGDAAEAAGLPAGVLNVVLEAGYEGSALMTTHPAVDQVSFTGSTAVGKTIMRQAADTAKRVMLELGGKSVQLYLPDGVDKAPMGFPVVFANHSGQACVAATRMLVPHDRKEEVLDKGAAIAARLTIGDPADATTMMGPLISAAQRDRCALYVQRSVAAGGRVVTGGKRPPGHDRGYYFEPTILDVPDNANPAAQEEIFGPVVTVIGYDTVDEAIAIANDSPYGLSGQVYSPDLVAATAVARRIRAGAVNVNGLGASAYASSGGYKESGLGRERGVDGLRAYQEIKHLSVNNW